MSFGISTSDIVKVIELVNSIRERFVDSPAEFKALSDEVVSLSKVLNDLEGLFSGPDFTVEENTDLKQHLIPCEGLLEDLEKLLDKFQELKGPKAIGLGGKSRRFWKRVTWEPDDIARLRDRLATNVGTLNAFTNRVILKLSRASRTGVEQLRKYQNEQKHREVLDWLSSSNFPAYHADILKGCQEATGQWVVNSPQFQHWRDGRQLTLFCPGIPGAGKTMITSIVIDNLQTRFTLNPDVAIIFLHFNYKRLAEHSIENLMASLLRQLLCARTDLPIEIQNLHRNHALKGTRPTIAELLDALRRAVLDASETFVLLDALDECADPNVLRRLFFEIHSLQKQNVVHLFATSRDIPEITKQFHKVFHDVLSLEICAKEEDIRLFLKNQMTSLQSSIQRNSELQDTITSNIVSAANGMFLLARLHLESLSDKFTIKAVKQALKALPKGSEALSFAYDEAFERIKSQRPGSESIARKTMSWLVYAKRELTREELRYALAIEAGSSELDEENLADADDIISTCAGLVTLDKSADVVRLVHYTAQKYFEKALIHWDPLAQEEITRTCITFLSFQSVINSDACTHVRRLNEASGLIKYFIFRSHRFCVRKRHQEECFLEYAAHHWVSHARECWNQTIQDRVLEWLESEEKSASCLDISIDVHRFGPFIPLPNKPTALHMAAFFGLETLAAKLLEEGNSSNIRDGCGDTPLAYLSYPHASVTDSDKRATAKLFLARNDIDVNSMNTDGNTPLYLACIFGCEAVAMMLLDLDKISINVQKQDSERSPLMAALHPAARQGSREILKLLLRRDDLKVNVQDTWGETALHSAASYDDDVDCMRMLLERKDIQVNLRNRDNNTVLSYAAFNGKNAIVRLLLQRDDVEVNSRGFRSRTPLMQAARNGYTETVGILLENEDVQKDCIDEKGCTALMLAYKRRHEETVLVLEQAGAPGDIPEAGSRVYGRRYYEYDETSDEVSSNESSSDDVSSEKVVGNEGSGRGESDDGRSDDEELAFGDERSGNNDSDNDDEPKAV